ncbi:hypothetical protein [Desulfovibrio intestinalis]|uniref:Uncharacterized protein n=1 Tax=Desulfovibrio intestinalis TaxID=58621 RepID=A0A7W8C1K0_9BACT|nr:hypothetical protein [Desulfovibrio intestinalis]MBB5143932.1 hypothetical protein [Desulfovibrio intestinalis]
MDLSKFNPRYVVRAITQRRPYIVVYCIYVLGEWYVQPSDRTEQSQLSKAEFQARYCLESDCPPKIKALFEGVPSFSQWRRGLTSRGGK